MDYELHGDEHDVNWRPLEAVLPLEECGGFMYMFWLEQDGQRLHHYKHHITRCYLILTEGLQAYRYTSRETYVPTSMNSAIRHALEDLVRFRQEGYSRDRIRRLATQGSRWARERRDMLAYHETDDGEAPG